MTGTRRDQFVIYRGLLLQIMAAVPIGIVIGALDTLFGRVLIYVSSIRESHYLWLVPFLPIAGAGFMYLYTKYGKSCTKGMSLIFEAGQRKADKIPLLMIPFAIIGTWLTHLFGASAGREGVAVQIGGTIAHGIGRKMRFADSDRVLLIAGIAAGFAGLFQTPIAAVFFSMEVLTAGVLEYGALLPALAAAYASSLTSHYLGLEKFAYSLNFSMPFNLMMVIKLVILGCIFGIAGRAFSYTLHRFKKRLVNLMGSPVKRIFFAGILISAFSLIFQGRYSGLGTNLIAASFDSSTLPYDFALKFLFTIVTLAAGFQGGEVTPLFAIGASLGAILAPLLGLPVTFAAALGYIALFASASNTMIAPVFIGAEVFGFAFLPYFFAVSAIAYCVNGNRSIYSLQKVYISRDEL